MAEDINQFYCRFDQSDTSQGREEIIAELTSMTPIQAILKMQQALTSLVD